MTDEFPIVDVHNPNDVIAFSQNLLIEIATDKSVSPKEKINAASALSRTALTQNRLKQDNTNEQNQLEINKAALSILDKLVLPHHEKVVGRSSGFVLDLPSIKVLPGETSTTQEEINYQDIIVD